MIVDEFVKMRWNSNNKKYYEEKGYKYTKMNDFFDLRVDDIISNSAVGIKVRCDICDNSKIVKYRLYLLSISNGGYFTCSQKCSVGKSKQTCLKNYGVESFIQCDLGKEKIRKTNMVKYGKEYASQNDLIKEKVKSTCLERFGTEYAFSNSDVKEKIKKTCIQKYGFESASQSEIVKDKIRSTCLDKYGYTHPTRNKEIMDKITDTQIKKYGEIWKNMVPKYNSNSIIYLDLISEIVQLPIRHALNSGEKKFGKYWIDGYIEEYNICIEWDERGHDYKKEYDILREEYVKKNNGCVFIRIHQDDFLKNIDIGILDVVNKIMSIIG